MRVDRALVGSVIVVGTCLFGCGGDTAVPIDDIPQDKKLVELTPDETNGVCQWAKGEARNALPPAGTQLMCSTGTVTLNEPNCFFPDSAKAMCTATVAEWRACVPAFLERLGADPCQLISLAFSGQASVESFVNETPGCAGLGSCAYTTM